MFLAENTLRIKLKKANFELILNPVLGWLEWSCSKEDLHGYVTVSKGREKLTDEAKSAIYVAFNNYPKWW
jgi:hypothetical protein